MRFRLGPQHPLAAAWRSLRRLGPLRLGALALAAFLLYAASGASFVHPAPTLLLRDRHGEFLGELAGAEEERGYWPIEALPERVVAATLAIEDRRFYHHPGVDPLAVGRALRQNLEQGRRISGASTLAMQVARLQRPGSRTYLKKAAEALTALLLTARYGREEILRQYLCLVPYGNRIHGIAYAARRYLAKPVADLSWAEIAFLTAIPQSPARMNPFDPLGRGRAIERGRRILDQLVEDGVLDSVEHQTALEEIERIAVPPRGQRPAELLHALLHWSETLGTPEARRARGARLILDTALDLELEKQVTSEAQEAVAEWQHLGAGNAAVLVVEKGSREVLAAVGSTGYFDREHAGAIDYLRVPRLAGSTLKPFIYALALERGQLSPGTPLDDLEPAVGGIVNADSRFLGPLPPRFALANSRNVPAANLLAELGVEQGYGFLTDLGLADGQVPASTYGVGLAVGGMPVTLEALTTAYTVLAGDGRLAPLVWLQGEPAARPRRMLSEETARELTLFLADPQARLPTFPRMGASEYPFPVAVKTGTSSHYRDAWAMAWSRRYLVGVWVGHPDYRPMAELSGYRSAARLAQQVMRRLHPGELDGLSDSSFPPPRGYRAERLCALSGGRATPACDRVFLEWLPPGSFPGPCTFHRQVVLDRRTGRPAVGKVPERQRELATFLDLPPRYAAWARSQGLEQRFGPSAPGATLASFVPAPGGPAVALAGGEAQLLVTSPRPGEHLLLDPETPPGLSTLGLRVTVNPRAEQVVWYVDGQPFATVDYPFTTRWPLKPGEHRFEARLPFSPARSRVVTVVVE